MLEEVRYLRTGLYRIHVLDGEALAAFCATTGQYRTATLRGHTCTETVRLRTLAFVRLISAFHLRYLSTGVKSNR